MKYYTPTIDEFREGFKYIEKNITKSFVLTDKLPEDLLALKVKYLDFDDIMSFNFVFENREDGVDIFNKILSLDEELVSIGLEVKNSLPYITIWKNTEYDFEVFIKQLHIKNINELEWILNRYGI